MTSQPNDVNTLFSEFGKMFSQILDQVIEQRLGGGSSLSSSFADAEQHTLEIPSPPSPETKSGSLEPPANYGPSIDSRLNLQRDPVSHDTEGFAEAFDEANFRMWHERQVHLDNKDQEQQRHEWQHRYNRTVNDTLGMMAQDLADDYRRIIDLHDAYMAFRLPIVG